MSLSRTQLSGVGLVGLVVLFVAWYGRIDRHQQHSGIALEQPSRGLRKGDSFAQDSEEPPQGRLSPDVGKDRVGGLVVAPTEPPSEASRPLSELDQRNAFTLQQFKRSLREFEVKPGLSTAFALTSDLAVAWSDKNGRSITYGEGVGPTPRQVITEEEWSIWNSDAFGRRLIPV